MSKPVTIVMPSYCVDEEVYGITARALESLRGNTDWSLADLIVVENPSVSMLGFGMDATTYVHIPAPNRGGTACINVGVRMSDSDYLVVTSTDVFVPPGWLEGMLRDFESIPRCGVLQAGEATTPRGITYDVHWWACVLMKRALWDEVGFLDEHALPICSDQDFNIRVRKCGYQVARTGNVRVEHVNMATRSKVPWPNFDLEQREMIRRWGYDEFESWVKANANSLP